MLYKKVSDGDGGWQIKTVDTDERVGRIWNTIHADRILRDSELAEDISTNALNATGASKLTAIENALNDWTVKGGHSVDFSGVSYQAIAGVIYVRLGGSEVGYYNGENSPSQGRIARFIALAEELFAASQIAQLQTRRTAMDNAVEKFRTDGGLA